MTTHILSMRAVEKHIEFYRARGDYGFLSNLFGCVVEFDGRTYPSSEHAYQHGKPKDLRVAEWIANAPNPRVCACAAHALLPYDIIGNWNEVKLSRMNAVVEAKFRQNPDLARKLLATGDAHLVEKSGDGFWGSGRYLSANGEYRGNNHLGYILMAVREKLKCEAGQTGKV